MIRVFTVSEDEMATWLTRFQTRSINCSTFNWFSTWIGFIWPWLFIHLSSVSLCQRPKRHQNGSFGPKVSFLSFFLFTSPATWAAAPTSQRRCPPPTSTKLTVQTMPERIVWAKGMFFVCFLYFYYNSVKQAAAHSNHSAVHEMSVLGHGWDLQASSLWLHPANSCHCGPG